MCSLTFLCDWGCQSWWARVDIRCDGWWAPAVGKLSVWCLLPPLDLSGLMAQSVHASLSADHLQWYNISILSSKESKKKSSLLLAFRILLCFKAYLWKVWLVAHAVSDREVWNMLEKMSTFKKCSQHYFFWPQVVAYCTAMFMVILKWTCVNLAEQCSLSDVQLVNRQTRQLLGASGC